MTITRNIYETSTLLGVMREVDSPQSYWLSLFFNSVITSTDEFIDFEKITKGKRKLAPFVMPMAQGKPLFEEKSRVERFKPAYIKAKDAVTPNRMLSRRPGELLTMNPQNPAARYAAVKTDILAQHRAAIERRWEWMAAKAILDGKVTITSDGYPTHLVDFNRAAGHTVTLGAGSRWGDSGVSILGNIQSWSDTMAQAEFGGIPNRLTVTSAVWAVMRKDAEIKAELDLNKRGNAVDIKTGLVFQNNTNLDVRYVGTLGEGLEVYVYNDFYHEAGTATRFMDPRDIVLTAPGVEGVQAFGAILDQSANFQPLPIYSNNWVENDPSVEFIMSQSSPIPVPLAPNCTFRARVLA